MDEELKHLLTNFATSLTTRLEQVESRLGGRMDRLEGHIGDVDGRIEQVETKLLTEFHKWASDS